jgi:hypothetical protein
MRHTLLKRGRGRVTSCEAGGVELRPSKWLTFTSHPGPGRSVRRTRPRRTHGEMRVAKLSRNQSGPLLLAALLAAGLSCALFYNVGRRTCRTSNEQQGTVPSVPSVAVTGELLISSRAGAAHCSQRVPFRAARTQLVYSAINKTGPHDVTAFLAAGLQPYTPYVVRTRTEPPFWLSVYRLPGGKWEALAENVISHGFWYGPSCRKAVVSKRLPGYKTGKLTCVGSMKRHSSFSTFFTSALQRRWSWTSGVS